MMACNLVLCTYGPETNAWLLSNAYQEPALVKKMT